MEVKQLTQSPPYAHSGSVDERSKVAVWPVGQLVGTRRSIWNDEPLRFEFVCIRAPYGWIGVEDRERYLYNL